MNVPTCCMRTAKPLMRSTASGGMFGFCRIAIAILPIELGIEHRLQRAAVQIEEHAAGDRDDRERDEDVAVLPAAEDRLGA